MLGVGGSNPSSATRSTLGVIICTLLGCSPMSITRCLNAGQGVTGLAVTLSGHLGPPMAGIVMLMC